MRTFEIKLQLNNAAIAAGGRLKQTADRRQFCFISVLFHNVRRALYITLSTEAKDAVQSA